jgi:hypothetical protein
VKIARGQILRLLDGQRVQVPTSVGLLEVEAKSDNHWQPLKRLPPSTVDQMRANHERLGMRELPDAIWSNDIYEVIVYWNEEGGAHLSIKRYDRAAVRNWRHLQQIKNEVCGEFREALELFPSEHRIADNANQMHLWVMPEGMLIPVGFDSGFVTIRDEDVEAYNAAGGRGRQEPMQPGLTIGQKMQDEQDKRGLSPAEIMARGVNQR